MKGEIRSKDDLPNIIGFIAQTEKSGVLSLTSNTDKIEIGFVKGSVNAAVYHRGGAQELIKEYLVNSGKISNDDFKKVLDIHRDTKIPLEKILFDEKHITQDKWSEIIQFKIQEIFDELFTWNDGGYEFVEDLIMYPNSVIQIRINTQAIMMEGMRRIDEWPNIQLLLPSTDIYFKIEDNISVPNNLGNEEKRIVQIVSPDKSLEDLIKISGLGKFLTYQAVYNLLKMNIIAKSKRENPEVSKTEKKVHVKMEKSVLIGWIVIFATAIILSGTGLIMRNFTGTVFNSDNVRMDATYAYKMENMDYLVRLFFLKYQVYPENLNELVKLKWVSKSVTDNFFYMKIDNGYVLKALNN